MRDQKSARLIELCNQQKISLAVAESVTVGRIQSLVGLSSGASDIFAGGVTAYNIDQKVKLLGVDRTHAQEVDCVSDKVASQMAAGVTAMFQADIGVATTGYAEPTDPARSHETYAYFAIYDERNYHHQNGIVMSGRLSATDLGRSQSQKRFANQAFEHLVDYLERRHVAPLD